MVDDITAKILQLLVDQQVISIEQANQVRAQLEGEEGADMRTLLVDGDLVDAEQYTQAYAGALNMTYVDLRDFKIPRDVLDVIPESTARGHMIIAYEQMEDGLKVAMANPSDRQIVEFIHKKVDMPVEVALASEASIRASLAQYQMTLEAELKNLVREAESVQATDDEIEAAKDLPTIKIVDSVLKHGILQGASDIHIEPTEKEVVVRYRVDGMLKDALRLPKTVIAGLVARVKVLASLKIDEHRLPQDGRFKIETDDYRVAFRVSILPVFDGEKIVMRLLDESGHGLGLDDIGMSERSVKIFRENISHPHGMILVTGPTGSGKTTTLYAAMKELNQPEVNISTVEDPIEYRMERINQTQVKPKVGLTFANGLRALVRQDPDIIMVGEIRDEETASLAVNAALTGHLVLSTLHTNSASGAIPRLVDMKVEPFLIATTANLVVAQRLVRRLCPDCRKEVKMDAAMIDSLKLVMDIEAVFELLKREGAVKGTSDWKDITVYMPQGCDKCTDGYKGRIGIYELLEVTSEIQAMITSKVAANALEDAARKSQNMVTMIEDGLIKVMQGITTVGEILRVAKE